MDIGGDQSITWEDQYLLLGEGDEGERVDDVQESAADEDGLCESAFLISRSDAALLIC